MIIILSAIDVQGEKPRDYMELVRKFPRLALPAADAEVIYVEGRGFVKDRNGDGPEQLAALARKVGGAA